MTVLQVFDPPLRATGASWWPQQVELCLQEVRLLLKREAS